MKIALCATGEVAIPTLEALVAAGRHAITCLTQPARPRGRGLQQTPSPIHDAATRLHVPVETPEDLDEVARAWQAQAPDLGIAIDYGRLIPQALLQRPAHGFIGLHPSRLPKYRGASPVAWAILNGEASTGVTIFRLSERMDAGEILAQERAAIAPRESATELTQRLALQGAGLLVQVVDRLERGERWGQPQDETEATQAPKLTKAMGQIRWSDPAVTIDRHIRALNPWPGAFTTWQGRSMRIWTAQPDAAASSRSGRPGDVVAIAPTGLTVCAGEGRLVIHELQVEGRRRMAVREFLAGHPLKVGERLGA